MIDRKKKLIFIQLTLLALGILVIYLTYYSKDENIQNKIISDSTKEKIKKQSIEEEKDSKNIFYNISTTILFI